MQLLDEAPQAKQEPLITESKHQVKIVLPPIL